MDFLYNRRLAAGIMAALMAVSIIIGGYRALSGFAGAVGGVFDESIEPKKLSRTFKSWGGETLASKYESLYPDDERDILYYVGASKDAGGKLLSLARVHLGSADGDVLRLEAAVASAGAAVSPSEAAKAMNDLKSSAKTVAAKIEAAGVEGEDASNAKYYAKDIESYAAKIAHKASVYNEIAEVYNKKIRGAFPAKIIASLVSLPAAEYYSEY